jgi:hypothetical protein
LGKALTAAGKTVDQQQESIRRHLGTHAKYAKVDAEEWIFPAVWAESQRVLAIQVAPTAS